MLSYSVKQQLKILLFVRLNYFSAQIPCKEFDKIEKSYISFVHQYRRLMYVHSYV